MAFCATCGVHFNGRGSHCTLHNPYIQDFHNQYAGASRDLTSVKYRTGRLRSSSHHRHRKHHQVGYHDNYDALDTYSPQTTLARYNNQNDVAYGGIQDEWANGSDPITHSTTLRPLTTTFNHLTTTHSIASLTYSVSPAGIRSITATANLDREQCPVCFQYFPDRHRLDTHTWDFPIGCEQHRVCLRDEDVGWHAQSERHERCFVRDCGSVYRREGGWRGSVVEGHVRGWHG